MNVVVVVGVGVVAVVDAADVECVVAVVDGLPYCRLLQTGCHPPYTLMS